MKSLLTPTMIKGIVIKIKESRMPLTKVAERSGITYQTLRNWLKNGEQLKQQIEDGKIKRADLTTKQKREVELFEKVNIERFEKEKGYLDRIHEIADKKEDIRAYQWLLKLSDPIYREVDDGGVAEATIQNSNDVEVVVNIGEGGVETIQLLSEFKDGSMKDANEEKEHNENTEGDRE